MSNVYASHSLVIDLPADQVWSKLRDLTLAPYYVPDLIGCELHPGLQEGQGASRRVFQKSGRWLDETVCEWFEGEGFLIRLHRGGEGAPVPFREAWFRYAISAAGERTRFTASLIYQPAGGVFGRLLDRLLLRSALNKMVARIAENMKAFYETGETRNPAFLPDNHRG